jgi:hypothetical protein
MRPKKKSRFINFDFPKKKFVAVASLNQPVTGRLLPAPTFTVFNRSKLPLKFSIREKHRRVSPGTLEGGFPQPPFDLPSAYLASNGHCR